MNKKNIAILLFILMFCGLFWSRALLSITQGAWLLFALVYYREWKSFFRKDPLLLWSICPLFLFFLGGWQQPLQNSNYDYFLTLTAYPVTALAVRSFPSPEIKKSWLKIWAWATVIGLLYPLVWYLLHITGSNKAYGTGQSLPTFMDTDHVRFGIFLCCSFLFAIIYWTNKSLLRSLGIGALFLGIIFLSVRTAWIILLLITCYFIVFRNPSDNQKKLFRLLKVFLLIVCVAVASYYLFPTVHQKIAYTIYDWQQFQPGKYDSNYSDGARRTINYAAWQSVTHANGSNTGWAGIPEALQHFFGQSFPGAVVNYGWPFNQFLFWWMGSGWWGMLVFSAWLLYPLVWGWRNKNKGLICWTVAIIVSCFAESTLSLQYGVFLHVWPIAILWNIGKEYQISNKEY